MFASKNMLQISGMAKAAQHRLPFIFTIYFDKQNEELCFRGKICVLSFHETFQSRIKCDTHFGIYFRHRKIRPRPNSNANNGESVDQQEHDPSANPLLTLNISFCVLWHTLHPVPISRRNSSQFIQFGAAI